jgi:integrase
MRPALSSSDRSRVVLAPAELIETYLAYLARTDRIADSRYRRSAERFFARWPDPMVWAGESLAVRRATRQRTRTLLTFLMLHRHLRPGYDYLLDITLLPLWRELPASPLRDDLELFRATTLELGFTSDVSKGAAGQVAARLLIQTGRPLAELNDVDIAAFAGALRDRQQRTGRPTAHYGRALFATRSVLYHLGVLSRPPSLRARTETHDERLARWGVTDQLRPTFVTYLERLGATLSPSTVSGRGTHLGQFGQHLARVDPGLRSLADLDRRRHIETYLTATAHATRQIDGAPLAIEGQRHRIIAVHCFLNDISEWGWPQAPDRRLIFPRDTPRRPVPLPRYIPAEADQRLATALAESEETLAANALLLARATGLRIGELLDLELDCVHQVPRQGAWLKVPLGKLKTERMVPLDDQALAIVDRIVAARAPGRPLPHPRDGRPVEFLLTRYGRRISPDALRATLARTCNAAGIDPVTPHQLRHTYATALINAGLSLQALMALLGHSSAAMSLRYGRLFDATVRADYERALALTKARLGPVLPTAPAETPDRDWREQPLIKARMAGGYCLRTAAQGVCAYTNICEHCPNYRSEPAMLAVLSAQRVDAQALADDAERRGWNDEAKRHVALVDRLDAIITNTNAA